MPLLSPRPLRRSDSLYKAGEKVDTVFFPCAGMVCEYGVLPEGGSLELIMTGKEGGIGLSALLGDEPCHHEISVLAGGPAWTADARRLRQILPQCATLDDRIRRNIFSTYAMVSQTAVCATHHGIRERCACRLLRLADRAGRSYIDGTQSDFVRALGTQLPHIKTALQDFQRKRYIRAGGGKIQIIGRRGLEAQSCSCYAVAA